MIKLRRDGNTFTVVNVGDCIIYKLEVSSIPPEKKGVENRISRFLAENLKITSFSAKLGKIEVGDSLDFNRSALTTSDGKKLTDDYEIVSLKFKGSTCGECGLTVTIKAD